MFYWYSNLAHRWYVMTEDHIIVGYSKADALQADYPLSKFCPCVENKPNSKEAI